MAGLVEGFLLKQGAEVAKGMVTDQVKTAVGKAMAKNPRVQEARRRMESFSQSLQQRFHKGRKAASEAALTMGNQDSVVTPGKPVASHAAGGDVAVLEDLEEFKDKWSVAREEVERVRAEVRRSRGDRGMASGSGQQRVVSSGGLTEDALVRFEKMLNKQ